MSKLVRTACMAGGVLALVFGVAIAAPSSLSPREWAFPIRTEPAKTSGAAPTAKLARLSGSSERFTETQLHDLFRAVDWWPDRHPTPPAIVVQGRPPDAMACGFCHLPTGQGRPENAPLAGLPANYIAQQVADMRSGARNAVRPDWAPVALMHQVATGASPAEVAAAADYFSRLNFSSRLRVVEAPTIPAVTPDGFVYRRLRSGPRTRLGARIVEAPDDFARFELRDPTLEYTAYVPPGSIDRGRNLASTGGQGRTQPCAACHGEAMHGGLGPPLAGRSPTYLFRQLLAFQSGDRHGASGAPMKQVTARLSSDDMIDLAAYLASLKP